MNARKVVGGLLGAVLVASLLVLATPTRAGTGDLAFDRCFVDRQERTAAGCILASGLAGAHAVALTADGRQLYVTNGSVLTVFDRDTSDGDLRFRTCFGRALGCNAAPGLDGGGAPGVAVSKDGRSIYVATACCTLVVVDGKNVQSGESIVIFNRDPATNTVTFNSCVRDSRRVPNGCSPVAFLSNPNGLDVSDDGKHVYVAAGDNGNQRNRGVSRFDRDAATGRIAFGSCVQDSSRPVPGACVGATGVGGARTVDVSPDGASVHVAASNTLVTLGRNAATGVLSFVNCIGQKINAADRDTSGPSPCPLKVDGLSGVIDVKVSDDGTSVYTAAFAGSAVGVFRRALSNGTTVFDSCFRDIGLPSSGCVSRPGLQGTGSVDVSADGLSVYAGASGSKALATFLRDRNSGQLTFDGCIRQLNQTGAIICGREAQGLDRPADVVVSDDIAGSGPVGGVGRPAGGASGTSVYVTSFVANTLTHFDRETPAPVAQGFVPPAPPDTEIGAGPARKISKRSATFFFSSDPGNTFECSLDGADLTPCTSPVTVTGLKPGTHIFRVVAIDDDGRRDATPAAWEFTVKKKKRRR